MLNAQKLTIAAMVQVLMISATYASEQSEAKGFVEDAHASVLFRNAWIYRDKKDPGVHDQSSWGQAAIADIDSGFTPGVVGFGLGLVGDFAFKIGDNKHSGQSMIPRHNNGINDEPGSPYDQWGRGGANIKARISNTTLRYGTQVVELPVLQSNTGARLLPEYYTGTLLTSNEIKGLQVTAGHFTKNQKSDHIATDQAHLKRAVVYGAKYKFDDQLTASYYGADLKDALNRHYASLNYKYPLAQGDNLTLDLSGYHTKFKKNIYDDIEYAASGERYTDKTNNIWAVSAQYDTGPHSVLMAYQQNTGNAGFVYDVAGSGGSTMYLPNSYLSDFVGNGEKSVQAQYSVNFDKLGVPGLTWTTAYVYGWDINVTNEGRITNDDAREREFFNQVKYTVQAGAAKDLSVKVRNSIYRSDKDYGKTYIGSTDEWRIFVEYPWKLF